MRIRGIVTAGDRMGRTLGYPTANIVLPEGAVAAADGVYAATVEIDGERHGAMANLGVKPTFGGSGARTLELHLLGFEGDLYGRELVADLVQFVRPERKFGSPGELRAQIEKDEKIIKKLLECI